MKTSDSNRELEERLSLLRPQSTSPEFAQGVEELLDEAQTQEASFASGGFPQFKLSTLGWVSAAVALIVISVFLAWPRSIQDDPRPSVSKSSSVKDPDPNLATLANLNLAIRRGDDIEELLSQQCNSFLPNHPLTDISFDGAAGFLQQDQ